MKHKKQFSNFTQREAFELLGIENLREWTIPATPMPPAPFFQERMTRLQAAFDLSSSEHAKELLIDAVCEEAILSHPALKIWKGAPLSDEMTTGYADYLIAKRRRYLNHPFLCVIEAKKDDFEKGLAQCLVEMRACQWTNRQDGFESNVFGIVTNGEVWKFYKLEQTGAAHESLPYSIRQIEDVLGVLSFIFAACERCATD